MVIGGGVAVRLASLCLDDGGRLGDYPLWDVATRGALLLDLALADRITSTPDSLTVDPTPTGFPPADRLLAGIAVEREHSLEWWLDRGGVGLSDVAAELVAAGRWTVRPRLFGRRYVDQHRHETVLDRTRSGRAPDADWTPGTAAVVALAAAAGVVDPPPAAPDPDVVARTGPVRELCEAVIEHLADAHRRNLGAVAGGGSFF